MRSTAGHDCKRFRHRSPGLVSLDIFPGFEGTRTTGVSQGIRKRDGIRRQRLNGEEGKLIFFQKRKGTLNRPRNRFLHVFDIKVAKGGNKLFRESYAGSRWRNRVYKQSPLAIADVGRPLAHAPVINSSPYRSPADRNKRDLASEATVEYEIAEESDSRGPSKQILIINHKRRILNGKTAPTRKRLRLRRDGTAEAI